MPAPLSIGDIENAIQHADPQTRHQTLRAVTDLFMSTAPDLDDVEAVAELVLAKAVPLDKAEALRNH